MNWCKTVDIEPTLSTAVANDRNHVIALYALHLAQGETLLCRSIKSGTIERYLQAAAKLSTARHLMDPRLDIYGKTSEHIKKVIREQKRWEDMPNRRETVTAKMIEEMWKICKDLDQDSFECAILDWNILGRYYGFRLSEWAQNEENNRNFPLLAIDGTPLAFTFDDFQFEGRGNRCLRQSFSKSLSEEDVENVEVRFRYQKNLDNGQRIKQTKNDANSKFCSVRAAARIRARARRLNSSAKETLAKFKDKSGKVLDITNKMIAKHLQACAKRAHGIRCRRALARWSAHSVRVGACVSLSEAGKDSPFIQIRLRWRSLVFRDYLRNTITLAQQHNEAI